MELVLVILFFSVSAAICMQVFASARLRMKSAADLSNAVLAAQEAGECFQAAEGADKVMEELFGVPLQDGRYTVFYDEKWQKVAASEAAFVLELMWEEDDRGAEIQVTDSEKQNVIYTVCIPLVGGAA